MSDMGWSREIANMEKAHDMACYQTAVNNGHSYFEAENCENGALNCQGCPFDFVTGQQEALRS